jgi:exodeoxyribonuclease V gamma subunit
VLHIHRAERADALADALADILIDPLEDPFAPDVVAVPTHGMERWLTQRLSGRLGTSDGRGDGVCANIAFPFPGTLINEALTAATGLDPDSDPWLTERSVWPLVRVVEASQEEAWLAPLRGYLGLPGTDRTEPAHDRRVAAVRHIADLFDRYGIHRPAMIRSWARGEDLDDADDPLAPEHAWQPRLWRKLRAEIGEPSPAERLSEAYEQLSGSASVLDWPRRVAVFPLTRLPVSYLQVLSAVATERDVHLFVLHPSPALWREVDGALGGAAPVARRNTDTTAGLARNWILASWGQDSRELQLVLGRDGGYEVHEHSVASPPTTLLGMVQKDVRENREPAGEPPPGAEDPRPALGQCDRSIQVHSCHGRARQVEVMRDAILHLLDQDETLEPRDVILMCPDIETFAPLIAATFGAGEVAAEDSEDGVPPDPRPADLRVRLADRSLRQTNPVLGVVAHLLELADSRVTVSELLSLADRDPVRRRFGFDDDELSRIQEWVVASGIHWGLDATTRAPFKLDSVASGTWRAGVDRVLLGVTMTENSLRLFGSVLPLDDVDSAAIDLAGRFAEYIARVQAALTRLRDPKRVDDWGVAITEAANNLTVTAPWDEWQSRELQTVIGDVQGAAELRGGRFDAPVTLADMRMLLADRLRGRPTRANFRTGHLTVCTLVPMRSVPHRVICLLGLDDNEFPKKAPHDGDDLLLRAPHIGDRSPRTEDRQMLLDALLASSDHLIVTYSGNDERTNALRPPAVPVGELLDTIDRTVHTADGRPAREQLVVKHPLQPFDPRNFERGKLSGDVIWSFDRSGLEGAEAMRSARADPPPFLEQPLPAVDRPVVELRNLIEFVDRPVRAFLRRRLGILVSEEAEEVDDSLPIDLDGLAKWSIAQRLLEARLAGGSWEECRDAEIARGELPPGRLGGTVVKEMCGTVEALVIEAARLRDGGALTSRDVRVPMPDGRLLTGTVSNICGTQIQSVAYSRVGPQHRLAAWVRLLALTAAYPGEDWSAATLGRSRDSRKTLTLCELPPLSDDGNRQQLAIDLLRPLIDIHDRGMREPLPIFRATSAAYAEALVAGLDAARRAAAEEWEGNWNFEGEDQKPEHVRVFGADIPFDELLDDPPRPDESGPGWDQSQTTRFERYAVRLWRELLSREAARDW